MREGQLVEVLGLDLGIAGAELSEGKARVGGFVAGEWRARFEAGEIQLTRVKSSILVQRCEVRVGEIAVLDEVGATVPEGGLLVRSHPLWLLSRSAAGRGDVPGRNGSSVQSVLTLVVTEGSQLELIFTPLGAATVLLHLLHGPLVELFFQHHLLVVLAQSCVLQL